MATIRFVRVGLERWRRKAARVTVSDLAAVAVVVVAAAAGVAAA